MNIFRKLGWFFKQEKKSYGIGVFFLILVAIFQIVPPKIIGNIVDSMSRNELTVRKLAIWVGILIFVAVGQYLFRYIWRTNIWGSAARLEKILRTRLFKHFMQMDQSFFQQNRTGDLMAHATNDLTAIQQVAGAGILTFADSIITGGTTIIAMVVLIDWRLTILAIIPLPLLAVMARFLGTKIHTAFATSQAAFSTLNNKTQESVSGIKVIKTLGQEQEDINDFEEKVQETIKINRRVNFLDALFDPITSLIIGLSYVFTIILGGYYVTNDVISIGQLISFISYIALLVWPMFAIGRLFNVIERGNASYDRVQILLNQTSGIIDTKQGLAKSPTGPFDFDIRHFNYPDDDRVSLRDVKFQIGSGQTLGIVGKTGAGKSTIMKLILREFDVYNGTISVNNSDIKKYALDAYLKSIGYVPQESFLFSTTIFDNIRFANMDLTKEDVEIAAFDADLDTDIMDLPQQYETEVGEQGISLSGGQKQRLAIARALVINPELLILDDALSAVDARTESIILSRLKEKRQNKTTIISASRMSSVMDADEIIVIDEGMIVERGQHETLMALEGWYYQMTTKQQLENKIDGGGSQ
ncbi:ABC transporter ATP-binding protein [Dellaglioa carnosa]|uniref:ABC transporter transmembrane domain-containing protein n=1 Tax=Dellaglioa carnosa TaxID=2995136 RepID=A0ABT4JKE0_9LACO|nr:ABC transporter transmembrane domain-containing protein [Dellaglioa carnosa]MCZ2490839.1 ABC transporter transmembrane domain-containing protein [Dellaglioa carnosa]MCZ2493917.1 ABC transporter transmembrane domain-containing protein [Dellaglioa carnosa]MDK1730781.1 ABC transporter transmembrane domain-containing protein [Dellaglioa carnosa]